VSEYSSRYFPGQLSDISLCLIIKKQIKISCLFFLFTFFFLFRFLSCSSFTRSFTSASPAAAAAASAAAASAASSSSVFRAIRKLQLIQQL